MLFVDYFSDEFWFIYRSVADKRLRKCLFAHLEFHFEVVDIHHFILQNEKSCVRLTVRPYALVERSENGTEMNYEHHSRTERLSDSACGERNKTTKSGFECWQGK